MLRLIGLKLKLAKRNIQMYFYLMRVWIRYKFARLSKRLGHEGIKEGGHHFPIRY